MIEQCKTPSHNTEAQKPSSASELCWQICRTVKNQLGAAIIGAAVQMLTSSQASALSPLTLHARSLFGVVALLFFFLSRFCPRRSKPLHHDKTCRGRDVPKRERERTHSVEGENTHTHTQKDKSTRKKNREEGAVGLRAVGGMEREAKGGWMKDHNTERKRDEVGKQSLRACQLVETKTPRTASRSGRRIREGLCCKVSVPKRGQPKIN
jgi:hypothetical protein